MKTNSHEILLKVDKYSIICDTNPKHTGSTLFVYEGEGTYANPYHRILAFKLSLAQQVKLIRMLKAAFLRSLYRFCKNL